MRCSPARVLPWLQDALGLLRTLCTLRWQPALSALLARLAEQQVDPLGLLSELFAAPPSAEAAAVQLESVQQATVLLHDRLAAGRPGSAGGRKQGSGGGVSVGMLGRALCVLCHPDRKLRQAGVSLAHACAQLLQSEELSGEQAMWGSLAALLQQGLAALWHLRAPCMALSSP